MLPVFALAAALVGAPLAVKDGEVRVPPPGVPMAAGYFRLENPTDAPVTVVGVSVDGGGEAMLHESVTTNGQARMVMLKELALPPHGSVTLAPGGKHLMLSLKTPPKAGETVGVTLRLADGRTVHAQLKAVASPR